MKWPLLLVEWVDSYGCSPRWERIDEIEPEVIHAQSVGWLVHEDENVLVLVPHVTRPAFEGSHHQGCGDMAIPLVAITKREVLRPAPALPECVQRDERAMQPERKANPALGGLTPGMVEDAEATRAEHEHDRNPATVGDDSYPITVLGGPISDGLQDVLDRHAEAALACMERGSKRHGAEVARLRERLAEAEKAIADLKDGKRDARPVRQMSPLETENLRLRLELHGNGGLKAKADALAEAVEKELPPPLFPQEHPNHGLHRYGCSECRLRAALRAFRGEGGGKADE